MNIVPVMRPLIEWVWPLPMPLAAALSTPLSTWKSPRNGASGERQGVIAYCDPSSEGIQYRSGMPFPLNQITKRLGIAFARQKRYDDAIAATRRSLGLTPRDPEPHVALARIVLDYAADLKASR